jgi:hypothetical protein
MPYITNPTTGQSVEVTQEQYNIWLNNFLGQQDQPVSPTADPEVPKPATAPSASSIDTAPSAAAQQDDPYAGLAGTGGTATAAAEVPANEIKYSPEQLDALAAANGVDQGDTNTTTGVTEQSLYKNEDAAKIAAGTKLAQQQTAIATQRGQKQNGDWRVRLQLAPQSNYLYNDPNPGILQPLRNTNGVIFPYTPKIDMSYRANYQSSDVTHSNYKNYFYQSSEVSDITLTAHFTAQSTADANYVLAVIHFFRTVTKMFYGQDAQRGSPPPLVFLSGYGDYQFNNHPCVVSEFTYALPDDVDYLRAQSTNITGLPTAQVRARQTVATNNIFASIQRLAGAFTNKGALPPTPFGTLPGPQTGIGNPTYVPTKIDITLRLIPVVSRQKVSSQFSVKNFANGNLLKGGFW